MEDKDSKNPMKKAFEVNICGMEFFFSLTLDLTAI